jgi:membrane protein required for colicin V production
VSGADWIIVVAVLLSIIHAAVQGFFQEAFAIAGLIAGYMAAAWQYGRLSRWLAPHVKAPWVADIAGFLIIFAGVMVVAGVLGRAARWAVREAGLSGFDHFLGGVLGILRGCLTVAVVLMGMAAFAPTASWLQGSALAPYFLEVGRAAIWVAPADLRGRFYQGLELLRQAQHPPQSRPAAH